MNKKNIPKLIILIALFFFSANVSAAASDISCEILYPSTTDLDLSGTDYITVPSDFVYADNVYLHTPVTACTTTSQCKNIKELENLEVLLATDLAVPRKTACVIKEGELNGYCAYWDIASCECGDGYMLLKTSLADADATAVSEYPNVYVSSQMATSEATISGTLSNLFALATSNNIVGIGTPSAPIKHISEVLGEFWVGYGKGGSTCPDCGAYRGSGRSCDIGAAFPKIGDPSITTTATDYSELLVFLSDYSNVYNQQIEELSNTLSETCDIGYGNEFLCWMDRLDCSKCSESPDEINCGACYAAAETMQVLQNWDADCVYRNDIGFKAQCTPLLIFPPISLPPLFESYDVGCTSDAECEDQNCQKDKNCDVATGVCNYEIYDNCSGFNCIPFVMDVTCEKQGDCPPPTGNYEEAVCVDHNFDGTKNCIYYPNGCLPTIVPPLAAPPVVDCCAEEITVVNQTECLTQAFKGKKVFWIGNKCLAYPISPTECVPTDCKGFAYATGEDCIAEKDCPTAAACTVDADCPPAVGECTVQCETGICRYYLGEAPIPPQECVAVLPVEPGAGVGIPETHPLLVILLVLGILFVLNRRRN